MLIPFRLHQQRIDLIYVATFFHRESETRRFATYHGTNLTQHEPICTIAELTLELALRSGPMRSCNVPIHGAPSICIWQLAPNIFAGVVAMTFEELRAWGDAVKKRSQALRQQCAEVLRQSRLTIDRSQREPPVRTPNSPLWVSLKNRFTQDLQPTRPNQVSDTNLPTRHRLDEHSGNGSGKP